MTGDLADIGFSMNKLKLIDTLRFEAEITKSEAAAVVGLFLNAGKS
jgi:hypothetical protein